MSSGRGRKIVPRSFSDDEKRRILTEYEKASTPAERAAVLRKEAIYTSHIANWRRYFAKGQGAIEKRSRSNPDAVELLRLRAENAKLNRRLEKAESTIEVLGKVHALLQLAAGESALDEQSSKKR